MKSITIPINEYDQSIYFSPIRSKTDYIKVLLSAIKDALLFQDFPEIFDNQKDYYFSITVDKMKRIIFVSPSKIYSLSFPFNVFIEHEEKYHIYTMNNNEFNSSSISNLNTVINDEVFTLNNSLIDYYSINYMDCKVIEMFEELLFTEPGYIRYDFDDSERQDPDFHPLNHFDFNYSNYCSLKVGLSNKIDHDLMKNFLDNNQKRLYIKGL